MVLKHSVHVFVNLNSRERKTPSLGKTSEWRLHARPMYRWQDATRRLKQLEDQLSNNGCNSWAVASNQPCCGRLLHRISKFRTRKSSIVSRMRNYRSSLLLRKQPQRIG